MKHIVIGSPPRLRLAVVGCGRVFERLYLPALRASADWQLVAAVDCRLERRHWIEAHAPGVAVSHGLAHLSPDSGLDAVLIAAPPESHCALAAEALRRGVSVLVEKPMALHLTEAESLLALAREHRQQIWVGFNRRFRPSYLALRRQLARLPKEQVTAVRYELLSDVRGWGAVSDYLGDRAKGGGVLDDIASHQLDLIPWLLDQPVREVRAAYERRRRPGETLVAVTLRFANGLEARCLAGHAARAAETLEVRLDGHVFVATRGTLSTGGMLPAAATRRLAGVRERVTGAARRLSGRPGLTPETFRRQLADWAEALRSGGSGDGADGRAGVRCVSLVDACRRSLARDGVWVAPAAEATA